MVRHNQVTLSIFVLIAAKDCVVVSRQALESWLSTHCFTAALRQSSPSADSDSDPPIEANISIACSDIVCEHGFLDPAKANDMKCITRVSLRSATRTHISHDSIQDAYQHAVTDTNCEFVPVFERSQICVECVAFEFRGKLSAISSYLVI